MAAARRVLSARKSRRDDPRFLSIASILSAGDIGSETLQFDSALNTNRITMIRSSQLPPPTFQYLSDCFNTLDTKGNGEIDVFQLKVAVDALGILDNVDFEEVKNLAREANNYRSSRMGKDTLRKHQSLQKTETSVGFNEFISIVAHLSVMYSSNDDLDEWKSVFDEFDSDKDGFISKSDLENILQKLRLKYTENDLTEMLYHRNDQRGVDFHTFYNFVA